MGHGEGRASRTGGPGCGGARRGGRATRGGGWPRAGAGPGGRPRPRPHGLLLVVEPVEVGALLLRISVTVVFSFACVASAGFAFHVLLLFNFLVVSSLYLVAARSSNFLFIRQLFDKM